MTAPSSSPSTTHVADDNAGDWKPAVEQIAFGIRRRVLEHVLANDGGYMSQACSAAETFAMLYGRTMRLAASAAPMVPREFGGVPGTPGATFITGAEYNGPTAPDLDRFVFSPAHYALVLYAALIEVGRLDEEGLQAFNRDGTTVEMIGAEHSPGIETTTGSLAQALSQAGGIALARQLRGDTGRTWVMMSDGEFQEGQTWEAVEAACRFQLANLRVIVDANGQQCDGVLDETAGSFTERLRAFGASAVDVDGHDLNALDAAMSANPGRPHFVMARTNPVQGLEFMNERAPTLHYLRFTGPDERAKYEHAYHDMMHDANEKVH